MSNLQVRQLIADTLSALDGINGYPYSPDHLSEGDFWVLPPDIRWETGADYFATWLILGVLPSDDLAAQVWFDAMQEEIRDTLSNEVGKVTEISMRTIPVKGLGDINAMLIELTKEG